MIQRRTDSAFDPAPQRKPSRYWRVAVRLIAVATLLSSLAPSGPALAANHGDASNLFDACRIRMYGDCKVFFHCAIRAAVSRIRGGNGSVAACLNELQASVDASSVENTYCPSLTGIDAVNFEQLCLSTAVPLIEQASTSQPCQIDLHRAARVYSDCVLSKTQRAIRLGGPQDISSCQAKLEKNVQRALGRNSNCPAVTAAQLGTALQSCTCAAAGIDTMPATPTLTATAIASATSSAGPDPTATATNAPTGTATDVPAATFTSVPSHTLTPVPSNTAVPSQTVTSTVPPTATSTSAPTSTSTVTLSDTPTRTATSTPAATPTPDCQLVCDNGGTRTATGCGCDCLDSFHGDQCQDYDCFNGSTDQPFCFILGPEDCQNDVNNRINCPQTCLCGGGGF